MFWYLAHIFPEACLIVDYTGNGGDGGNGGTADGIGAYIAQQTIRGDHPRVALGIAVMSLYVVLFNRLFWKRLYAFAQRRLALD